MGGMDNQRGGGGEEGEEQGAAVRGLDEGQGPEGVKATKHLTRGQGKEWRGGTGSRESPVAALTRLGDFVGREGKGEASGRNCADWCMLGPAEGPRWAASGEGA